MAKPKQHEHSAITLAELDAIAHGSDSLELCYQLDELALRKWRALNELDAWQAVLLHSGIDPDTAELRFLHVPPKLLLDAISTALSERPSKVISFDALLQLKSNYLRVLRAIRGGKLPLVQPGVGMAAEANLLVQRDRFLDWALEARLPVAGPWPLRGQHEEVGWLRFQHVTTHLKHLEQAARELWGDSRGRSLGRSEVAEHLMRMVDGPSRSLAKAMATILRPDDQPKGRPPKASPPVTVQSSAEVKRAVVTVTRNR